MVYKCQLCREHMDIPVPGSASNSYCRDSLRQRIFKDFILPLKDPPTHYSNFIPPGATHLLRESLPQSPHYALYSRAEQEFSLNNFKRLLKSVSNIWGFLGSPVLEKNSQCLQPKEKAGTFPSEVSLAFYTSPLAFNVNVNSFSRWKFLFSWKAISNLK